MQDNNDDERDTSYLTAPFLTPEESLIKKLVLDPPTQQRPQPPSLREIISRVDLTSAVDRAALEEWDRLNFTYDERDMWLEYGLNEYEAALAADCRQARPPPAALRLVLEGTTVAQRLRAGEPAAELFERLQAER